MMQGWIGNIILLGMDEYSDNYSDGQMQHSLQVWMNAAISVGIDKCRNK